MQHITKNKEELYLIWLNDYLTTEQMARDYKMSKRKLEKLIDESRIAYLKKYETPQYLKVWGIV